MNKELFTDEMYAKIEKKSFCYFGLSQSPCMFDIFAMKEDGMDVEGLGCCLIKKLANGSFGWYDAPNPHGYGRNWNSSRRVKRGIA